MLRSDAIAYVESLGFSDVTFTKLTNYSASRGSVCELAFEAFSPKAVRASLGKATKHVENRFAFRLSKTRGIRVNTKTNRIWICNGLAVVRALMESI